MTQDQRNGFVKLLEQVRHEVRSRHALDYDEGRELRAEREKEFEAKHNVTDLRRSSDEARKALVAAEAVLAEAERKVRQEVCKLEREDGAKLNAVLGGFTLATAEILALDDAKEAQKVIERLAKL